MNPVTVEEIIQTLYASGEPSLYSLRYDLADRIKAHGIAPSDGLVLVPVEPTKEMIAIGWVALTPDLVIDPGNLYDAYKAILSVVKEKE